MTDGSPSPDAMTHRETVTALSGLLFGMFVVVLSANVVNTSLPKIIADLGGSESAYTWVVTSAVLSMTVTTPLWGKFADLYNRKFLVQLSLLLYVISSALAGFSQTSAELIFFRVLQGMSVGGIVALVTVIMADLISPRQRGRYMGYLGACTAAGTVSGPLIGGVVTDSIGWRWNFYIGVPLAAVALVMLQRTLHLPHRRRNGVRIDYLGALLISVSVSLLLIWVTLGGQRFPWASTPTTLLLGGALLFGALFIVVETRAAEPILPLRLFRNRTVVFAIVASIPVGVVMFSTTLFLSQYLQLSRGKTPTVSGLLTLPMVVGTLTASTLAGRMITRSGHWKRHVVTGGVLLPLGVALLGTLRQNTSWFQVGLYMAIAGVAVGLMMQNLVMVAQNVLPVEQMGTGTATVAFFRTLGGAAGVSAMGALLAHRLPVLTASGLSSSGVSAPSGLSSNSVPDLRSLPEPVRAIVETAYGHAIGNVYLAAVPLMLLGLLAVIWLPNRELGEKSGLQLAEEAVGSGGLPADVRIMQRELTEEQEWPHPVRS